MNQADELSLWVADGWFRASGDEAQGLLIEDLQEQVAQGSTLSDGLAAISTSERQPGDFGMEIAGSLLAPILVELLKDFWSGYLKKLGENAGGALADSTTKRAKEWFLSLLHKKEDHSALSEIERKINQMAELKKLSKRETTRLLETLRNPKLAEELSRKK